MDTLLRFVTVRNPRKPSQHELNTGFIFYDSELEAPLTEEIIAQRREDAQSLAISRRTIRQYREESSEYIHTVEDIERSAPGLVAWAEWLAAEAHHLTVEQFREFRAASGITIDRNVLRWLWDNLLAYTYAGGVPEMREIIIWSIRVANLLEQHEDGLDEIRRLAQSTVVLPSETHVGVVLVQNDNHDREPEEPSPPPAPNQNLAATYEQLERIEAASQEINRRFQDELERARADEVRSQPTPPIADEEVRELSGEEGLAGQDEQESQTTRKPFLSELSEKVYARLGENTRQVLRELDVPSEAQMPYVLDRLQNTATKLAQSASEGMKATQRVVQVGGSFWVLDSAVQPAIESPPAPLRPDETYQNFYADAQCKIKPLGTGELRRVEQRLLCYEPGEVAHIENVLIGESKERNTRRLRRTEEIFTVTTEEERTEERDTQTTDRFELQKETSRVVQDDLSFELGVQVSGSWGPVQVTTDTNFATSTSTVESDRKASNYAREVTERANERIVARVREERTTRILEEFEESNKHVLNNADGDEHIVGLYRWVDKVYEAKVVNYGKRLMFEFLIPEPGAFHIHAMVDSAPVESVITLEKPIDPRTNEIEDFIDLTPIKSHKDIKEEKYALYAGAYGAEVSPPPAQFVTVSKAYHRGSQSIDTDESDEIRFAESKNDLTVPTGYEAKSFDTTWDYEDPGRGDGQFLTVAIGGEDEHQVIRDNTTDHRNPSGSLNKNVGTIPIWIVGDTRFYGLTVEVQCERTQMAFEEWQIKTFNAIMDAYNQQLAVYNTALAEAQARVGVEISGTNPRRNRETERLELQKGCVRLLSQQCRVPWSNAMADDQEEYKYPEFDCCKAIDDGTYVQFLEQAFEWNLMTYLFYPYFWGHKKKWKMFYQLEDPDPLFLSFLQAGYARVVVPVREGYDEAVMRFLADGIPWNGGSVPGIDDPMYVSIANELKDPVGEVDESIEPWEIRVPTTLTALQCESGCVEGRGLPCYRDEES